MITNIQCYQSSRVSYELSWFKDLLLCGFLIESIAFQGLGVKKGVEFAYEIADAMMEERKKNE